MKDCLKSKKAITFVDNSFNISNELKEDLKSSKNPNIVLIIGPSRSGKSTLCNTLLSAEVNTENGPFDVDEGNDPITEEIQYFKIKISELTKKFDITSEFSFDPDDDSELFIFDSEGIGSLGKKTSSLRKAIMAILQISTINIFNSKNFDISNIYDIKSFFTLPQIIPGSQQKLNKSWAITLIDIGVPGKPTEDNFEIKRKENDEKQLEKFLSSLKEHNITFSKENTAFFAQPKWTNAQHYLESIKDLVRFIVSGASKRMKLPGQTLVDIFEKVVPIISNINELDDQDIKLEVIIQNLIDNYYKIAYDYSIDILNSIINERIIEQPAEKLIELSKTNFFDIITDEILEQFKQKVNEIFENISSIFPQQYQQNYNKLKEKSEKSTKESFENCCKSVVLPYLIDYISNFVKEKIKVFFDDQTSDSLRSINLQDLIKRYQKEGNNELCTSMNSICHSLNSQPEFITSLSQVQSNIADITIEENKKKCDESPPYPKNLEEARKAGQLGNQVTIWPNGQNMKCATFNVNKDNKLEIPNLIALYKEGETKDGNTNIVEEETKEIETEVDVDSMTIKLPYENLHYWERKYHLGIFRIEHIRFHYQKILLQLQSPFCFSGGVHEYTISSMGHDNKEVPKISFFIQ